MIVIILMKGRNPALLKRNYPKLIISKQSHSKERQSNKKENSPMIMVRMLSASGSLNKKQNNPLKESRKQRENRFRQNSTSYSKNRQSLLEQAPPQQMNGLQNESEGGARDAELQQLTQKIILSLTGIGLMMRKEKMVQLNHGDLHFILKFLIRDNLFQEVKANRLIEAIKEHSKEMSLNQRIQNKKKALSLVSLISIKEQIIMKKPLKTKNNILSVQQTNLKITLATLMKIESGTEVSPIRSKTLAKTATITELQSSSESTQTISQLPGKKAISLQERSIFDLMSTGNLQQFKDNHKQLMKTCIQNQQNARIKHMYQKHKEVKQEMHNYALFLKDHRYAISSYSPTLTIQAIGKEIANCIQQVQEKLREGQDLNFEQRYLILKNFTDEVGSYYDSTLKEMIQTIQIKTQFCRQFVSKVYKWYENHQSRSKLLSKQKEEYSEQLFHIYEHLHQLYLRAKEVPSLADRAEQLTFSIVERVVKIDEIFIIGNNFY